jgi:hypothetical protein
MFADFTLSGKLPVFQLLTTCDEKAFFFSSAVDHGNSILLEASH